MNKNPAVSFYFDNFRGGCVLMSYEEKGRYIDLLGIQAHIYPRHIPHKMFADICGDSAEVLSKFIVDDNGDYYNGRMEKELDKAHRKSVRAKLAVSIREQNKMINDESNDTSNDDDLDTSFNNLKDEDENINNNCFVDDINNNASKLPVTKSCKANKPMKSHIVASAAWRTSFDTYRAEEQTAYNALRTDADWLASRQRYHHTLDILLTLEKAHLDFWNTEEGWKHKRKSRASTINWQRTFENAIDMRSNWVYKPRATAPPSAQSYRERKAAQECPSDTSANLPIIDIEQYNKTEAVQ